MPTPFASGRSCRKASSSAPDPVPMSSTRASCAAQSSAAWTIVSLSPRGISVSGVTANSSPKNSCTPSRCATGSWAARRSTSRSKPAACGAASSRIRNSSSWERDTPSTCAISSSASSRAVSLVAQSRSAAARIASAMVMRPSIGSRRPRPYSAIAASRFASSSAIKASTSSPRPGPAMICGSFCSVRPIRWSVTRPCG